VPLMSLAREGLFSRVLRFFSSEAL
jgi:hypothetical protein